MSNDAIAKEKLTRARTEMLRHPPRGRPFWSYLALHIQFKAADWVPTAGVMQHSRYVYYNEDWIASLPVDQVKAVVCHELIHLAFGHPERRGKRDPMAWNVAADLWDNATLVRDGFTLPGGLIPTNDSYTIGDTTIDRLTERFTEEIYSLLPKRRALGGILDDHSKWGEDDDSGEMVDWPSIVSQATQHAKLQGNLPYGADRWVEVMAGRRLDWRALLRAIVAKADPYDYTWARPSRRSQALGVYYPSILRESLEMAAVVDTSGSMSERDLGEFKGLMVDVIHNYGNARVHIVVNDAGVHDEFDLTRQTEGKWRSMPLKGGGGTDFRPAFNRLVADHRDLRLIVYYTDGYGTFPEHAPPCKVVWLLQPPHCEPDQVPFGQVIPLERYPINGNGG